MKAFMDAFREYWVDGLCAAGRVYFAVWALTAFPLGFGAAPTTWTRWALAGVCPLLGVVVLAFADGFFTNWKNRRIKPATDGSGEIFNGKHEDTPESQDE